MGKLIFRSKTIVVKIGLIGVLILTTICVSLTVHARTVLPNQIKPQKKSVRVLYGKNEILPKPPITVHIEYHGKMKDYKVPQDTVENTLNRLHIQLGKDDVMGWELSDMITDDQTIVITKIEYKEETREEIIPYKTEIIDADDMLMIRVYDELLEISRNTAMLDAISKTRNYQELLRILYKK